MLVGTASLTGCSPTQQSQAPFTLNTVAGYVVPWDSRSIVAVGRDELTEVSPVWYQPTEGGQIVFASRQAQRSQSSVETQTSSHGSAIVPTISNFRNGRWDGELIHHIITDPQTRAAHIAAIMDVIQSRGWAGIDLDYESLQASDREAYSAFIRELAITLHRAQKRLTLTVHAKTAEPGDWSGAHAQDWRALGKSADEVRVMAYDYSTENSSPGPIAPLTWVRSVLKLAVSEVPREKIVLGVATYGYDWPGGQEGHDVQWADAEAIARDRTAAVMWDPTSQSPWFSYADDQGHPHTVWYENARSLHAKLDLARQYRVAGVFIWRLGGEDPAVWEAIRQAT